MEEEIEENCECGLTEDGSWDESLFDEWGCDCESMGNWCRED